MTVLIDLPYFPRPQLLAQVFAIYDSGLKQGVTLFAPRRQGKTLFARRELIPAAESRGWRPVYLDLWARRGQPDLGLVEGLEVERDRHGAWRDRLYLRKLTARARAPGVELGSGSLETRLSSVLDSLVAVDGRPLFLVLDEFQALAATSNADFIAAVRTAIQRHQGRLVVFYTGSSREALNNMFRRQRAPLFESAHPLPLPDLDRTFVIDRAELLRQRTGIEVDVDRLDQAFDRVGRSPEFLNTLIIHMMIEGNGDIESAIARWLEAQGQDGFGPRLAGLGAIDIAVLHLLATPDHPKAFSKAGVARVASLIGGDTPVTVSRIQAAIKRLLRHELVAPTGGYGEYEIDDRGLLLHLREAAAVDAPDHRQLERDGPLPP